MNQLTQTTVEKPLKKQSLNNSLQKTDELNPKWATFTEQYLETGNAYKSALAAGFTESYALVITTRFPEKVRKSLKEALDAKGITAEKIADKIGELLDAKKGEEPDYSAIDKGIAHAVKVRGDYTETPTSDVKTTYNFIFSSEVQERVSLINEDIKKMLTQ